MDQRVRCYCCRNRRVKTWIPLVNAGGISKRNSMKLFRWVEGRQSTTRYHKWCFLYFKIFNLGLDGYIIRYQPNTVLPIHKDSVEAGRHWRLNIKVKGKCSFWCPSTIFRKKDYVILFRPDLFYHSVTVYEKTYKISFGLAIFHKSK